MQEVWINKDAFDTIRKIATGNHPAWEKSRSRKWNGLFPIQLDDETYKEMLSRGFEGESVSDLIIRMAAALTPRN